MVSMSEFDDVIRKAPEPEPEAKKAPSGPAPEAKSLVELLTADGDLNSLGNQLNLDQEMTEKVLVPLVSFLDKYGVGESVSTNPTVERGMGLFGFISDVAPVLRSAAEYFQGKRTELSAEDEAFLDRIREAQGFSDDMDLFVGTEIGEAVEEEIVEVAPVERPKNPFTESGAVDWNEMLGVPGHAKNSTITGTIGESSPKTNFGITGLEALAAEAGLSVNDVMSDRQSKTNNNGGGGQSYEDGVTIDVMTGMDEITKAMKSEQDRQAATSKVNFEANDLATPDALQQYSPNMETPAPAPAFGVLESVDDLMAKYDVSEEQMDNPAAEVDESVSDDDLEWDDEADGYRHRVTGEIYEAVDLTEVPDDYFGTGE